MFFKYFYLMDFIHKLSFCLSIILGVSGAFTVISLVGAVDGNGRIIKKNLPTVKIWVLITLILGCVYLVLPSENSIKALVFDKVVVENRHEIKDMAKDSIDYIIDKIKELNK